MAINTVINTNMMALTAHRNLGQVGNRQNKANQRLSSGKKINSAADDAAGLAISEKMKAQIRGLDMAAKNSEDAISLIQTAEGSLTEVNNMLTRVRELTVQAANDTNQKEDREKIAQEVSQLLTEIDSISDRTEFNEKKLNDGSFKDGFFQIGANSGQSLGLSIGDMSVDGLGIKEIKDVFGIDKPKGDRLSGGIKIVGVDGAVTAATKVAATTSKTVVSVAAAGASAEGEGTLTIKVGDELKEIKFNHTTNQGNSANSLADALKEALGDDFNVTVATGDITITAVRPGAESNISFVGGSTGVTKSATATNHVVGQDAFVAIPSDDATKGTVADLVDGTTITINGKSYTKVADGNEGNVENGFSDLDELNKLLEKDGLKAVEGISTGTGTNKGIVIESFAKGYKVDNSRVSEKGEDYSKALKNIDSALKKVTTQRANLGANQNRLEYTIKNLELSSENLNGARSRIEDTDMAKEMMNLTQANVLQQAATSILAQANQAPNNITQLLG